MLYSRERNSGGVGPFGSGPVPFDSTWHNEHAGLYLGPIGWIAAKLWLFEFLVQSPIIIGMHN